MGKIIEIELGEYRPAQKVDVNEIECQGNDLVIIQVDRGQEFGRIVSNKEVVCKGKTEVIKAKIIRKVTEGDHKQIENNRMKAREAVDLCLQKISERKLDMQIVKAEYTFDNSKIIFFFTADERVDFRGLVQDLARVFRIRIELKQIGVRDKARIVSGYGVCGRELCCSSFIKDFHALSIKMAKAQDLPLNPSRISGVCGRIKCCMAYEYTVYKEYARALPKVGDKVDTPDGKGKVVGVNIIRRLLTVDMGDGKFIKVDASKSIPEKAFVVNR